MSQVTGQRQQGVVTLAAVLLAHAPAPLPIARVLMIMLCTAAAHASERTSGAGEGVKVGGWRLWPCSLRRCKQCMRQHASAAGGCMVAAWPSPTGARLTHVHGVLHHSADADGCGAAPLARGGRRERVDQIQRVGEGVGG